MTVSPKAIKIAAALIALHFLVWWYVWFKDMAYDQGDLEGLLWWLGAFWILPAIAVAILLVNFLARWLTNEPENEGE